MSFNSVVSLRASEATRSPRGIPLAALRAPLLLKLLGANVFVVATVMVGWTISAGPSRDMRVAAVLAVLVLAIHAALTVVALRPIRDLETAVSRVWRGDYGARVERSAVADNEVLRVGAMFNLLLDGLSSDRARMRNLAAEVIDVGDRERAALARELHDSTAQRTAALLLQISAAARDAKDPELAARLQSARDTAEELTNEIRLLAQTVHPRVLDDLGLVAALRKLARDASRGSGIDVDVDAPADAASLPRPLATALYRAAQEAVRNAMQHASPRQIRLTLSVDGSIARLEVHDDGQGFDFSALERQPRGTGLLSIRDRLALLEGWLDVRTAQGGGTTVIASIPLNSKPAAQRQERT